MSNSANDETTNPTQPEPATEATPVDGVVTDAMVRAAHHDMLRRFGFTPPPESGSGAPLDTSLAGFPLPDRDLQDGDLPAGDASFGDDTDMAWWQQGPVSMPPAVAQDVASRVIDRARAEADEIIAAARRIADHYTNAALERDGRVRYQCHDPAARLVPATGGLPAGALSENGPEPSTAASAEVGELWYSAVLASGVLLSAPSDAVARTLSGYAGILGDATTADPLGVDTARCVGAELVQLGICTGEALARSLSVLSAHLGDHEDRSTSVPVQTVLYAFAAGYHDQCEQRTLDRQTALHRAAQSVQREKMLRVLGASNDRLAHYDPVTGLAGKTLLHQRLELAAASNDPIRHVGLCLIGVQLADTAAQRLGADAGEHLLAVLAGRLANLTRDSDYLVTRHATSTFAVMVDNSGGLAHMAELAHQIQQLLQQPVPVPAGTDAVPVRVYIGVVDVPSNTIVARDLLIDAESALRQAHDEASGWAVHRAAPGTRTAVTSVPGLAAGPVAYQPIIDPGSGRILGLHHRRLWRHERLGPMSLRRIGDLTGDGHLITQLARTAVNQACDDAMRWQTTTDGPFVGLHLPLHQIPYPDVLDVIGNGLDRSGLPPARLHLYLSGLDAIPAGAHSHTVLAALADLGIRIELDDFGTGYTSFTFLRDLPVHGLRTPARIMHDPAAAHPAHGGPAHGSPAAQMFTAMTGIAHALELTLTVHGVDDDHHAAAVTAGGCDAAQGEAYGPPINTEHVTGLLTRLDSSAAPGQSTREPTATLCR